jgi:hypothetical protein
MRLERGWLSSEIAAMADKPTPRRRRRRPTRPNVYVNIFGAPVASGSAEHAPALPAEAAEAAEQREPEEPLVSPEWLERRGKRLTAMEQELRERALELERRESELDEREARFEADAFFRENDLETRERALAEQEQRLGRREHELGSYVARVQGGMLRADAL